MKKYLLLILLLLIPISSWGTDYYGGSAGKNLNANDLWYIQSEITGSCAATGTPVASSTVLQAGNNLYANGCTIAITDSFTATKISNLDGDAAGSAVAGGHFTWATAGGDKTFTTNLEAGAEDLVTITGSTSGSVGTIIGNITGGSGTGCDAIYSTHTVGTITIGSVGTPTTITGGSNAGADGVYLNTSTGRLNIIGNATGNAGPAIQVNSTSLTSTITGNCTGGTGASTGVGCLSAGSAVGLNIVGNIINGTRAQGVSGNVSFDPGTLGTHFRYIRIAGDGSPATVYAVVPPAEADVKTGVKYGWDGDSEMTGSLAVTGGGAYAY